MKEQKLDYNHVTNEFIIQIFTHVPQTIRLILGNFI